MKACMGESGQVVESRAARTQAKNAGCPRKCSPICRMEGWQTRSSSPGREGDAGAAGAGIEDHPHLAPGTQVHQLVEPRGGLLVLQGGWCADQPEEVEPQSGLLVSSSRQPARPTGRSGPGRTTRATRRSSAGSDGAGPPSPLRRPQLRPPGRLKGTRVVTPSCLLPCSSVPGTLPGCNRPLPDPPPVTSRLAGAHPVILQRQIAVAPVGAKHLHSKQ